MNCGSWIADFNTSTAQVARSALQLRPGSGALSPPRSLLCSGDPYPPNPGARLPSREAERLDPACGAAEGGQPLAADVVPEGLRLQDLHVFAVAQEPPSELWTHGNPEGHLQLAREERRQGLARVPLPLGNIPGGLPGKAQPDADRIPPEQAKATFEVALEVEFRLRLIAAKLIGAA